MKKRKALIFLLVLLTSCQTVTWDEEKKIPLPKNPNYVKPDNIPYDDLSYENYSEVNTVASLLTKIEKKESFAMYLYSATCDSCIHLKGTFLKYICNTKYVFSTLEIKSINTTGSSLEEIVEGLGTLYPQYFGKDEDGRYHFTTPHFYFFLNGEIVNEASGPDKSNNYSYFVSFMNRYVKEK